MGRLETKRSADPDLEERNSNGYLKSDARADWLLRTTSLARACHLQHLKPIINGGNLSRLSIVRLLAPVNFI